MPAPQGRDSIAGGGGGLLWLRPGALGAAATEASRWALFRGGSWWAGSLRVVGVWGQQGGQMVWGMGTRQLQDKALFASIPGRWPC